MKQLREERGNRCQIEGCLIEYELQFAHIKPTGLSGEGRGQSRRVMDIIRNPECYKLMCRCCHGKFDRDYWRNKVEN